MTHNSNHADIGSINGGGSALPGKWGPAGVQTVAGLRHLNWTSASTTTTYFPSPSPYPSPAPPPHDYSAPHPPIATNTTVTTGYTSIPSSLASVPPALVPPAPPIPPAVFPTPPTAFPTPPAPTPFPANSSTWTTVRPSNTKTASTTAINAHNNPNSNNSNSNSSSSSSSNSSSSSSSNSQSNHNITKPNAEPIVNSAASENVIANVSSSSNSSNSSSTNTNPSTNVNATDPEIVENEVDTPTRTKRSPLEHTKSMSDVQSVSSADKKTNSTPDRKANNNFNGFSAKTIYYNSNTPTLQDIPTGTYITTTTTTTTTTSPVLDLSHPPLTASHETSSNASKTMQLADENAALKKQLNILLRDNAELWEEKLELSDRLSLVTRENAQLSTSVTELREDLTNSDEARLALERRSYALNDLLDGATDNQKILQSETEILIGDLSKCRNQKSVLMGQLSTSLEEVSSLNAQISAVKEKNYHLLQQLASLTSPSPAEVVKSLSEHNHNVNPSPQYFLVHQFRRLKQKKQLLQAALSSDNPFVLHDIVITLRMGLADHTFATLITPFPEARDVYISYALSLGPSEWPSLLTMLHHFSILLS